MKEYAVRKSRFLFPLQLAEDANRGFVKVVQHISHLISYDFHTNRADVPAFRISDRVPDSHNRYQSNTPKPDSNASATAPVPPSGSDDGINAQSSLEVDPVATVTLLFSDFAEERLSAIRWISDNKYSDALPMLESILLIEDNHQVYEEASNLINILRESEIETRHRE